MRSAILHSYAGKCCNPHGMSEDSAKDRILASATTHDVLRYDMAGDVAYTQSQIMMGKGSLTESMSCQKPIRVVV